MPVMRSWSRAVCARSLRRRERGEHGAFLADPLFLSGPEVMRAVIHPSRCRVRSRRSLFLDFGVVGPMGTTGLLYGFNEVLDFGDFRIIFHDRFLAFH